MYHPIWSRLSIVLFAFALFVGPSFGEEEKKADSQIKECTAAKPCDAECKKESKEKPKKKVEAVPQNTGDETTNDNDVNNKVGDVKVYNYGIQAIFINSDVTVSGGTVSAEMTKSTVAPGRPAAQQGKPDQKPSNGGSSKPSDSASKEKPGKFDELIKDATKEEGLFTVYTKKDDKIYWEIKPDQLEKNFLVSGTVATGLGDGMVKPGAYMGGLVVEFRKIDDKLQLMQRNLRFTAPEGSTEEKALQKNYKDSIIATFPVDATNPENSAYTIEMGKFFLSDLFNLSPDVNDSLGGSYGFDRGNSYVIKTKVFPENVVVRSLFAYRSNGRGGSVTVPNPGSAQVELLVDVRPLNDNPDFVKRIADTRVGHFLETRMDFSEDEKSDAFVRYVSKWDVRKASPDLEVSPPVKPIVVWIENTVPKKYRQAIRDGLLEWNKAFEKIGVKDVMVVKEQPDDAEWDVSDARYNTIHWNESYSSAYSGIAQWVADPRTGEILHGSFLIEAESLRSLLNLRRYREPDRVAMVKSRLMPEVAKTSRRLVDNYQQEKTDQAAFGMTIMAARAGIEGISEEVKDDFVNQYLFSLICHEFGHVLGLRHNFEGSTMLPVDRLHNKALTKETSLTSSIMEYTPVNIAPEGVEQGYYFEPCIGPYDYLAIEYAYREIKPATGETEADILNAIAEREETPELTYGTDEDLYGGNNRGIDPLCNRFDLGRDPLNYAKQQTQLIMDTIPKLPKLVKDGDTYLMVRNAFNRLMGYYFDQARFAMKYIGGQYVNRVKKGGANDRPPLEPVSAARQREAINFLVETIFSDRLFEVEPELLNMLAAEKWYQWGTSWPGPSSEYPLSTVVQNLYDTVLYSIYSPVVISRIIDAEKQRPAGEVNFTVPELFRRLKQGVWNQLYDGSLNLKETVYTSSKPLISTYRRILQREHLKVVTEIMLEPPFGMPDDARTQAWRTLVDLDKQLDRMLKDIDNADLIDDYSYDHLAESSQKIKRALDARLSARVDLW